MEQIFVKVKNRSELIDKDIRDTTYQERTDWYRGLTKGMVIQLLEKVGKFDNKNNRGNR